MTELSRHDASGRAVLQAVRDALREAVTAGDAPSEYLLRMRLLRPGREGREQLTAGELLEHVARCAALREGDPDRFPDAVEGTALSEAFCLAVRIMSRSVRFSRAQTERAIERMLRLAPDGAARAAAIAERLGDRIANGFPEEAQRDLALLDEALDALSLADGQVTGSSAAGCEVCGQAARAQLHLLAGRDDEAIGVLERILVEERSCDAQPEALASMMLPVLLRAGRGDDARELHLGVTRDRCARLDPGGVGGNIAFCGMTGNTARGLELLVTALPSLAGDPVRTEQHLALLSGAAILLEAICRDGHGAIRVAGSASEPLAGCFGPPPPRKDDEARDFTAAELAPVVLAAAQRLAAAYDERNGNDYMRWRLESALAQARETPRVPIGARDFSIAASATVPREPADDDERLRIAHIALMVGDLAVARAILDAPLPRLSASLRGYHLSGRARVRLDERGETDPEGAGARIEDYLAFISAAGRPRVAAFYRELGPSIFGPARPGQSARVREIAARHRDPSDARLEHAIMSAIAEHALADGDPRAALEANLAAARAAGQLGEPDLMGSADASRMIMLAALGQSAEADAVHERARAREADAATAFALGYARMVTASSAGRARLALDAGDALIERLLTLGLRRGVALIAEQTARMLALSGRRDEAVDRQRLAIGQLTAAGDDALAARTEFGRLLVHAGRPDEAIEVLSPIAQLPQAGECGERDSPGAEALFFLAYARQERGERQLARETWLMAREAALGLGRTHLALAAARHAGQSAAADGHYAFVERELRGAVAVALEHDEREEAIMILDLLGLSRAWSGDRNGLDDLRHAAALAAGTEGSHDIRASFAIALAALGDIDAAVSRWLLISDEHEGDAAAHGMLQAVEVLAGAGRAEEAITLCEQAAELPGLSAEQAARIRERRTRLAREPHPGSKLPPRRSARAAAEGTGSLRVAID